MFILLFLHNYSYSTFVRIVHAFTCAGVLPSQYIHFSDHARLGKVGPGYIKSGILTVYVHVANSLCHNVYHVVYYKGEYLETVNRCGKLSMMKAVSDVKALPSYSTDGEVAMLKLLVPCVQ